MELFEGSPAQSDPIHYKCHVELNSELSMSSRRLKSRALERPVSNPRTQLTTRTTGQLTDQVVVILATEMTLRLADKQTILRLLNQVRNQRFYHLLHKWWPRNTTSRPHFHTPSLSYILISFSCLFLILFTYPPKTNICIHFLFTLACCSCGSWGDIPYFLQLRVELFVFLGGGGGGLSPHHWEIGTLGFDTTTLLGNVGHQSLRDVAPHSRSKETSPDYRVFRNSGFELVLK